MPYFMNSTTRRREPLFEFAHGANRWRCDLVDLHYLGVEVHFFLNDEFHHSRRFEAADEGSAPARDVAIAWAHGERQAIETAHR